MEKQQYNIEDLDKLIKAVEHAMEVARRVELHITQMSIYDLRQMEEDAAQENNGMIPLTLVNYIRERESTLLAAFNFTQQVQCLDIDIIKDEKYKLY